MPQMDMLELATWAWLAVTFAAVVVFVVNMVRLVRTPRAKVSRQSAWGTLANWPIAAALFSYPQGRTIVTNDLWKDVDGEPNLDREIIALVHAAHALPNGAPVPREMDRFVLHARWFPESQSALVFATARESGAQSGLVLGELVHIASKEWRRALSEVIHDIAAHRTRSAFLHDQLSMVAANEAATVLDKILGPASDLLPGKLGDWANISVEDLAHKAADSATVQGLEVLPIIDSADARLCVRIRPDAIHHIFRNLGQNAVFHNESTGAWVVVETTESAPTAPRRVFIHFLDNGTLGLDPIVHAAIRAHKPVGTDRKQVERLGLGYGLYVCHAFAEQNYGSLDLIEDAPTRERLACRVGRDLFGEKSVGFTLTLPITPSTPTA